MRQDFSSLPSLELVCLLVQLGALGTSALVEAVIKAGEAHTLATAIVEVPEAGRAVPAAVVVALGDGHALRHVHH